MMIRIHNLRRALKAVVAICLGCLLIGHSTGSAAGEPDVAGKPNFIIIFTDDQGYQDLGSFGSKNIRTPHLDKMAKEGMRFTHFYAQTVCGPSRAALMTGCYPLRVAKKGNNQEEIHPLLHTEEVTIAEILKAQGYASACFGKWDLAGHRQKGCDGSLLPTRQGFDYFFGTATSNDTVVNLLRNEKVIGQKVDMAILTESYTDEALAFIRKNKDKPFFVYIPHTMPHLRLAASEKFRGKSARGLYGDVIEELDYHSGRILKEVEALGLKEKTYVIFTSDNGPWFIDRHPKLKDQRDEGGSHGGDARPLRGHKTSAWEGGIRVPCIVWAPGRIPEGTVCQEIATTMDILPTLTSLAGGSVPDDRVIDGHDISNLFHGNKGARSPTKAFYYYLHTQLMAVRSGQWKLHLPRKVNTMERWDIYQRESDLIDFTKPLLFDLEEDPGESTNLASKYPETVAELMRLAELARNDIGDYDRVGKNARFFDPEPRRSEAAQWLK